MLLLLFHENSHDERLKTNAPPRDDQTGFASVLHGAATFFANRYFALPRYTFPSSPEPCPLPRAHNRNIPCPPLSSTPRSDYHSSGRMMLNLSAALGRLVLSGRELARLSGFSSRVTGLIDVIDDVNRGVYKRGQDPLTHTATTASRAASGLATASAQGIAARTPTSHGDAATVAAAAAAEAEMAHARTTPPLRRNAGVAGVNLAAEHSPPSVRATRRTTPTTPPAGPSSGHDDSNLTATAESVTALGRLQIGELPSKVRGQPELAPEGSAGSVAAAAAAATASSVLAEGGGARGAGFDGSEVEGAADGARLVRQGSVLFNEDSVIEFTDVPLVTPTGEVLIEALSFKVLDRAHCMHAIVDFHKVGP